jgi:hypothetical protein
MATATTSQDVGSEIAGLVAEASALEEEGRVKLSEAQGKFAQIRDLANSHSGDYQVGAAPAAPASPSSPPAAKRGGAAKKKVAQKPAAQKPAAKRGGAAKKKSKKTGPVSPSDRNYDNELTLKQAIWDALDRDKWPTLEDIPSDATGLRAGELKTLLDQEGKWTSKSADPGNQISGAIGVFRTAGKIARGDGQRYYIVAGAEIDGPDLDDNGKPVK